MEKLLALILALAIVPIATAQVTLEVCEADGETPFDCNEEIMTGTKLTLIVSSDSNSYWSGGLFIKGQDRAYGTLAGRDLDPNTRDYTGSHYEDAGDFAKVTAWKDSAIWGFDLYTFYPVDGNSEDNSTVPGDCFIIDYKAEEVGDCNVGFYDYDISWDDPNYFISFFHVPTRDLNSDEKVDFGDFAIFASQWSTIDCNDPNWCSGADLDFDGFVDYNDLRLFVRYWLWEASDSEPSNPEDPNVTYSIVDANGLSEITIDVGGSITLYVDMVTTEGNNVDTFDIEVNISDPNLGSIYNKAYDPNDPNDPNYAQILAEPRNSFFDYWGPGLEQEEGIELFGISFSGAMSDGHLASFVFTCEGQGDITLELINWSSSNTDGDPVFPKLESILIHQVEVIVEGMGGEMFVMEEAQQTQSEQDIDIDELVSWLEEIWLQEEEIREIFSEAEWQEFIDSVKNPY